METDRMPLSEGLKKELIPYGNEIVIATNFLYKGYKSLGAGVQRDDGDTDGIRGDLAIDVS